MFQVKVANVKQDPLHAFWGENLSKQLGRLAGPLRLLRAEGRDMAKTKVERIVWTESQIIAPGRRQRSSNNAPIGGIWISTLNKTRRISRLAHYPNLTCLQACSAASPQSRSSKTREQKLMSLGTYYRRQARTRELFMIVVLIAAVEAQLYQNNFHAALQNSHPTR